MQFREFAENLLGSKVKIKLIRRLLSDETITSERELAGLIGVSHVAVNKALKEFHEANLVSPLRVGAATIWQLNKASYAYAFLIKFSEKIKTTPLDELKNDIKFHFSHADIQKAVIFGSVASGTELPTSDIDLFFLVENDRARGHLSDLLSIIGSFSFISKYGNKLSLNIFTKKDYSNPKNKKFLDNVSKGIVVFEK